MLLRVSAQYRNSLDHDFRRIIAAPVNIEPFSLIIIQRYQISLIQFHCCTHIEIVEVQRQKCTTCVQLLPISIDVEMEIEIILETV